MFKCLSESSLTQAVGILAVVWCQATLSLSEVAQKFLEA